MAVFVIEREFVKAAGFALAGAVLTYFGFMHGEAVGIGNGLGVSPSISVGYLLVAGVLLYCKHLTEAPAEARFAAPAMAKPALAE
jgi:AGZA family xanthine/uracil permease-like MFS transporter